MAVFRLGHFANGVSIDPLCLDGHNKAIPVAIVGGTNFDGPISGLGCVSLEAKFPVFVGAANHDRLVRIVRGINRHGSIGENFAITKGALELEIIEAHLEVRFNGVGQGGFGSQTADRQTSDGSEERLDIHRYFAETGRNLKPRELGKI